VKLEFRQQVIACYSRLSAVAKVYRTLYDSRWRGMAGESKKSRSSDKAGSKFGLPLTVPKIVMVGMLVLIAYQVYNGLMFQEFRFGPFSLSFFPPSPRPPETPDASREFFVGRWQVEQQNAVFRGATFMDYFEDGSFSGLEEAFQGDTGRRVDRTGEWEFARLAKDRFRLILKFSDGRQWNGDFTIVNRDRIHNVHENYDAVRVPR
jgi:hypothetical protein